MKETFTSLACKKDQTLALLLSRLTSRKQAISGWSSESLSSKNLPSPSTAVEFSLMAAGWADSLSVVTTKNPQCPQCPPKPTSTSVPPLPSDPQRHHCPSCPQSHHRPQTSSAAIGLSAAITLTSPCCPQSHCPHLSMLPSAPPSPSPPSP